MRRFVLTAAAMLIGLPAFGMISGSTATAALVTREIPYEIDGSSYTGYLAYDDTRSDPRPGVLVVHEWWGHNAYARKRAEMLAGLGYTALALDMYGSGKLAAHPKDATRFMNAVLNNKQAARTRFLTALALLQQQPMVDPERVAAIGYCFGGGIVLHMARAGIDLDGVVSFHGSLGTDTPAEAGKVKAKVRVFTGAADPFVPAEQVTAFQAEMKRAGVDFQVTSFPGVKHSFTNPEADTFGPRFGMPLAYDAAADAESWAGMKSFFRDIFQQ